MGNLGDIGGVGGAERSNGRGLDFREVALELELLLRDSSGSLRNTHSRPRDVHLAQGYSKLHLILDSAQACESVRYVYVIGSQT